MIKKLVSLFILSFSVAIGGMEEGCPISTDITAANKTVSVKWSVSRKNGEKVDKAIDLYFTKDNGGDALRAVFKEQHKILGTQLYTCPNLNTWEEITKEETTGKGSSLMNKIKGDFGSSEYDLYNPELLEDCYAVSRYHLENDGIRVPYLTFKKVVVPHESEILRPDLEPHDVRCYIQGKIYSLEYDHNPDIAEINKGLREEINKNLTKTESAHESSNFIYKGHEGKEEIPLNNEKPKINSFDWRSLFKFALPTAAFFGIVYTIYYKWFGKKVEQDKEAVQGDLHAGK